MATATSFHKKSRGKAIQIPGTRPSLHNNQLLTSTGIPSFDNFIGGGIAIGTAILIEEDRFGSYGKMMLKYFLSEGILTRQQILVSSAECPPELIISELPAPLVDDPGINASEDENEQSMKIAWRYQHQNKTQATALDTRFGHYYDLTKNMPTEQLNQAEITTHDANKGDIIHASRQSINLEYARLLKKIRQTIIDGGFDIQTGTQHKNILRIGIHALGSPQWGEGSSHGQHIDHSLCRFLYGLRSLLRNAFAVCCITMPSHLFDERAHTERIERLCDTVVILDSFIGSDQEKNPAFREYHGLFNIKKLPRLNTLSSHMPETLDLAFKLKRKKFMIEKLHLPPELSETANRNQEDPILPRQGRSCESSSNKLDF